MSSHSRAAVCFPVHQCSGQAPQVIHVVENSGCEDCDFSSNARSPPASRRRFQGPEQWVARLGLCRLRRLGRRSARTPHRLPRLLVKESGPGFLSSTPTNPSTPRGDNTRQCRLRVATRPVYSYVLQSVKTAMSGQVAVSERMGSPNKVRIGHLSEKLVSLQDELEHEKQVTASPRPASMRGEIDGWAASHRHGGGRGGMGRCVAATSFAPPSRHGGFSRRWRHGRRCRRCHRSTRA